MDLFRTRDLFVNREIKEMTGSYSARCGAMKMSTRKVVTEEKEVKEIWQQYIFGNDGFFIIHGV